MLTARAGRGDWGRYLGLCPNIGAAYFERHGLRGLVPSKDAGHSQLQSPDKSGCEFGQLSLMLYSHTYPGIQYVLPPSNCDSTKQKEKWIKVAKYQYISIINIIK